MRRTIRLAVAVLPAIAAQPAPEPLAYLTGGPGGIALFTAHQLVEAGFNRSHDLILRTNGARIFPNRR